MLFAGPVLTNEGENEWSFCLFDESIEPFKYTVVQNMAFVCSSLTQLCNENEKHKHMLVEYKYLSHELHKIILYANCILQLKIFPQPTIHPLICLFVYINRSAHI